MISCSRCKETLPLDSFYVDKRRPGGHKSQCKACHTEGSLRTRDRDRARDSNAKHMRLARELDPERFRARERSRPVRDPIKKQARQRLNVAVRAGLVVRPTACARCGAERRVAGHHYDYSRPLDVEWLCYPCHGKEHRHG